jgi:hypothetical protein
MKIAQSLQAKSTKNNKDPILYLLNWSRMWKVDSSYDSVTEINAAVYATDGARDQLPISVHG